MNQSSIVLARVSAAFAPLAFLVCATTSFGHSPDYIALAPSPSTSTPDGSEAITSTEQGQTPLSDSFTQEMREWRLEKRREAFRDTTFSINLRSYYFDRQKYDGTESQAFTIGGWAGLKTGYFLEHVAFGVTGYMSQPLYGEEDKDGTQLLKSGQQEYYVLGEAYADVRFVDDLHLYVGRKEYDTPYINRDDSRMTPKTFEAITLVGKIDLGRDGGILKYGAGYFDRIKERNSDRFVSMAKDAGATVSRGVYTAGALYQKGDFSIGAIDYYSPDILNIAYAEAKVAIPVSQDWRPKLAFQFTDQRSVGGDLLKGTDFSAQQFGLKVDLPCKDALFTVGYTQTANGASMQNPWSSYPGYTAVQVEDFNRAGEGAFLLRAAYKFTCIDGLSAYALWVHGSDPEEFGQFRKDEGDLNLEWAPTKGKLQGLGIRVRYAGVRQHGGNVDDLQDFRVICNYALKF